MKAVRDKRRPRSVGERPQVSEIGDTPGAPATPQFFEEPEIAEAAFVER